MARVFSIAKGCLSVVIRNKTYHVSPSGDLLLYPEDTVILMETGNIEVWTSAYVKVSETESLVYVVTPSDNDNWDWLLQFAEFEFDD